LGHARDGAMQASLDTLFRTSVLAATVTTATTYRVAATHTVGHGPQADRCITSESRL
jgi:hypothetical protein